MTPPHRCGAPARWIGAALLGFSLAAGCADTTPGGPASSPAGALHRLRVGDQTLLVEVAATGAARRRGLMFRRSLPPGRGMLFIFGQPQPLSFWMKDTPLALDIAFADETGRILQIERMEPFSETAHVSRSPVRYALEVPAGWFAEHRIAPGAVLVLSESIRRVPVE